MEPGLAWTRLEDDVPNTNAHVVNSGSMWVSEPGRMCRRLDLSRIFHTRRK